MMGQMVEKEKELIRVLNKIVRATGPIPYKKFNIQVKEKLPGKFVALEKRDDRIGIRPFGKRSYKNINKNTVWGTSVLAIMATMTDVLVGKRLAAKVDDDENIIGFCWYKQPKTSL